MTGSQSALGRVRDDKRVHLVRGDRTLFDLHGRSAEQRIAIDLLADPSVGIVSIGGPAGTGKSVMALAAGLEAVVEQRTHKRVLVFRPIYPVGGQDLGFLPGTEAEKMAPWAAAVTDALESIVGREVIEEVFAPQPDRGPAADSHPRSQLDRHVRDHRRGTEPRAGRAAHRAVAARRRQPRRAHPRRRAARQPPRRTSRRHRVGDRRACAGIRCSGTSRSTRSERSPIAALVTDLLDGV